MTDAEKKAKKKAKKAAQKVQEEKKRMWLRKFISSLNPYSKTVKAAQNANADKEYEPEAPKDDDPDGMKLITSSDPLEHAAKLLHPLKTVAAGNIDAWVAIYDVAVRRSAFFKSFCLDSFANERHSDFQKNCCKPSRR